MMRAKFGNPNHGLFGVGDQDLFHAIFNNCHIFVARHSHIREVTPLLPNPAPAQSVLPPTNPVAAPSAVNGKGMTKVVIPPTSWLVDSVNTKKGVLETWQLPDGRKVTVERVK
jgi:hypothetical protein